MRIHRHHDLTEPPTAREDHTTDAPARRPRWRPRRRRYRGDAEPLPGPDTGPDQTARVQAVTGETLATAMQSAIALITAGLDSPELEAWAADLLAPDDAIGLGDFMGGLHALCLLLLNEVQEATGEPSAVVLQRLALMAEGRRGTPSGG
jgi:hypothetical protein